MIDLYRYRGRRPPLPHMIASVYSGIHAAGPDQGLTLHEVRGILNLMVVRTNHKPFCTCDIHPVNHSTALVTSMSMISNVFYLDLAFLVHGSPSRENHSSRV